MAKKKPIGGAGAPEGGSGPTRPRRDEITPADIRAARLAASRSEAKLITQWEISRVYGIATHVVRDWATRADQTGFPRPVRVVERTSLWRRCEVARFFRDEDAR